MNVEDILAKVLLNAERHQWKDEKEKLVAIHGLRFLISEAQRPRSTRPHKQIKETWLSIWPILNKYKLLAEFQKDATAKHRVRFFIDNGFGI